MRKVLLTLSFPLLLTTCTFYDIRNIVPDSGMPLQEKSIIILHQGNAASCQLSGARWVENQLTGLVAGVPRLTRATKPYELHLNLRDEYRTGLVSGAEIAIPIEMISSAMVYDLDLQKTTINTSILTSVLSAAGVTVGCGMFSLAAFAGSCPCVYAGHDGQYFFVGEIYAGAVQPALERHDYLPLESIRPFGEEYRLRLANELQEVQHTNLAELIVCDHPHDTALLVDKHGFPHTILETKAPLRAIDSGGSPVIDELSRRDGRPAAPQSRHVSDSALYSLYVTFPRPQDARSAKLVLRARNSLWLDYCYYRFQKHFGTSFAGWQARQKNAPADEMLRWKREQGIALSVYVQSGQGWKYVDCFNEIGPLAAREQVLVVDFRECPSNDLEIKLESGFLFWEVDFLGVDYAEDLPVTRTTVSLLQAENQASVDVSTALRADDGKYYDQRIIGDSATLRFPCPALGQGLQRTLFLHTKGYYEVIRDFSGEPDLARLKGFREPGAFPRYSCELFSEICQ